MNQTRTTAPAQAATPSQQGQASLPNFLHVSHNSPVALEAYLHLYVDGIASTERELASTGRGA